MPTPTVPDPAEWITERGVAVWLVIVLVFVGLFVLTWVLWFARDYWKTRKPLYVAKWKAQTEREQAGADALIVLTAQLPAQTAILKSVQEQQIAHGRNCEEAKAATVRIEEAMNRFVKRATFGEP